MNMARIDLGRGHYAIIRDTSKTKWVAAEFDDGDFKGMLRADTLVESESQKVDDEYIFVKEFRTQRGDKWMIQRQFAHRDFITFHHNEIDQTFETWLHNHSCSTEELWKIQNCLISCLGESHPLTVDAVAAWHNSKYPNASHE